LNSRFRNRPGLELLQFSLPLNDSTTFHVIAEPISNSTVESRSPPIYEEGMDDEEYARRLQEYYDDEEQLVEGPQPPIELTQFLGNIVRSMRESNYENLLNLGEQLGSVSKGMSNEDIEKLDSYVLTEKLEQVSCPICQDDFIINETKITKLVCGHIYCTECIKPWLEINKTCPVCREEQPTTSKEDVFTDQELNEDGVD
jgi:hypothetical protein